MARRHDVVDRAHQPRGCSSRTAEEGHPSDRPQEQEGSREGKMKKEESEHEENVPEWVARLEQLRRESAGERCFWTPEEQIAQLRALDGWPEEKIEQSLAVEGRHERPDLSALRRSLAESIKARRAAKERERYKVKREEILRAKAGYYAKNKGEIKRKRRDRHAKKGQSPESRTVPVTIPVEG